MHGKKEEKPENITSKTKKIKLERRLRKRMGKKEGRQ
jgi:hypothetical protein